MGQGTGTDYDTITYEVRDGAVRITLARPATMNLIGDQVFQELSHAFVRARDEAPSVVVFGSTGRYFSAGGDLAGGIAGRVQEAGRMTSELAAEMYRHVHDDYAAFNAIEACPKTVVASINGPALGAAAVLILLCDLAVASTRAELSFAPGRWGIVDAPSAARLGQRVGLAVAKDLLYTARAVDGREAQALGLVNRVVPHGDLGSAVEEYVRQICTTSPGARAGLKRVFASQLPPFAVDEHFRSSVGPDFVEGVQAFAAGRPPAWAPPPSAGAGASAARPAEARASGTSQSSANGSVNGSSANGSGSAADHPLPGTPTITPWFAGTR